MASALFVTMMLWSKPASSEPTLAEILKDYEDPGKSAEIASSVAGIATGLSWANTALRVQTKQPALYCFPDDLDVQPDEFIELLQDALNDDPRLGDRPVGFALLTTLQRAFPCK